MLHLIPDSDKRWRLFRVVVLQLRLVRELCALPVDSSVEQNWLCAVWKCVNNDWVRRFWENDKGNRAIWINRIAAAKAEEKKEILAIAEEQLRFRELWDVAPSVRLRKINWNQNPFRALNALLKCFYAPLFYCKEGYEIGNTPFHKEHFLGGIPSVQRKVCPYCDNFIQKTELDHFLPKDEFPFLSCHPDNLIPSCHDSNSGSHKGTTVPLDWNQVDQAGGWFHPRLRSANGRLNVNVEETPERALAVKIEPIDPLDDVRVTNLDNTFQISKFWTRQIEGELQIIMSQVVKSLQIENINPSEQVVKAKLLSLSEISD